MASFISKENLILWLKSIMGEKTLIAPIKVQDIILFAPVSQVEDIALDYEFSVLSPKNWFLLPSEVIFVLKDEHIETPSIKEAVLFGIHPCDALAIRLLDSPFLSPPADILYKEKREKTTLIGLGCVQARPECFCTSAGTGPLDASYVDVLLIPVAEGFIVEVKSEKGKKILALAKIKEVPLFPPAPPSLEAVPLKGIEQIAPLLFTHLYWQRLADRCIHCNICAYVCPCCYCFDIRDYSENGKIERVRSWDSCQSTLFTQLAGGYEPRPSKSARLRNRFYHKFLYFYEQFGQILCSGCGRCVRTCPVNIDIREVIKDMVKIGVKVV